MTEWSTSGFAEHVVVLDRDGTAPRIPGFSYRPAPPVRASYSASQRRMIDAVCRAEGADVFLSTEYTSPETWRSVMYLYDMIPEVLGWDLNRPVWREKRRAIEHSSLCACLSESTASDLHRVMPQTAAVPFAIALPGVNDEFKPSSAREVSGLRERLGLPAEYFVFLGHRDDYKNANLVFEALEGLQAEEGLGILLVGGNPVLEPHLKKLAGRVPVCITRLSDADLRAAYTGAAALLYVSRYEGFGLPILEGMACGCPVITCRNSSLPEAAGPAALYVSESDPEELRTAMRTVREPNIRAGLVERGFEWSARFTWRRTAEVLQDALTTVSAEVGPHPTKAS
jgi:glycosyltransferase involved in cell wall biosynthesis